MKRVVLLALSIFYFIGCVSVPNENADSEIINSDTFSAYENKYGTPTVKTFDGLTVLNWEINNELQQVFLTNKKGRVVILSANGEINEDENATFIPLLPINVEKKPSSSLVAPSIAYTVLLRRRFGETVGLQKSIYETGRKAFYLFAEYRGSSWRFMDGNIQIKCDNNPAHSFSDSSPGRRVLRKGTVVESLFVGIPEDVVNEMASANKIQIQYYNEPVSLLPDANTNILRLIDAE